MYCPRGVKWKRAGVDAWNSATCSASGRHSSAPACPGARHTTNKSMS